MDIKVKLTDLDQSNIIKNMYPLYLHDLSEHYGHLPNQFGIYEDSDEFKTLQDQYAVQSIWWEKPGCLYPFLIMADGKPAGFCLIATAPHCNSDIDYFVNDFFVLRPYRRKGVAEAAAVKVFDEFRGKWELFTNPSVLNLVAPKFWRRTVSNYSGGDFKEYEADTFDGYKLVFRFENTLKS